MFRWSGASGKLSYYGSKDVDILRDYLKFHHEYYEYDQFDNTFELLPSLDSINLDQITDESLIYKSFSLFPKALWSIRFSSKFVSKVNDFAVEQIYYILGFVYSLANGNFGSKTAMKNNYGYIRAL